MPSASQSPSDGRGGIARNVLANWFWYMLVVASGFVIPRLVDDYQGQKLLGVWDIGWSLVIYVNMLGAGVGSSVNRYVARHRTTGDWAELNAVINSALVLLTVAFALGIGVAALFSTAAPYLLGTDDPELAAAGRSVIFLLAASSALQLPFLVFNGIITGCQRFDKLNVIRVTRDLLVLGTMIACLLNGLGIVALALVVLCGEAFGDVLMVVVSRRLCPQVRVSPALCRRAAMKEVLRFGGKTVLQGLSQSMLYQFNSILVLLFLGPAALAIYSRQRSLVVNVLRFVKQYAQVFTPASSSLEAMVQTEKLRRLAASTSKYGLFISLPIMLVLILMGGPLLNVWMGEDYEAPVVLAILAFGHLFSVAQLGMYSIMMGMGKHGWPALIDLAGAVTSVLLALLLIGILKMGITGAAIAVAVPVAIGGGIAMPLYACRTLGLNVGEYVRNVALRPIVACVPLAACLLGARSVYSQDALSAVVFGLGSGGLVTIVIYWWVVVPQTLRARVGGTVAAITGIGSKPRGRPL